MIRSNQIRVKLTADIELKQSICRNILNGLPDWFGIPKYIEKYVSETKDMPFYVSYLDKEPIGFLALKQHNKYSAEIYVIAVNKEYHRCGVGTLLVNACVNWCLENEIEFLQVKTLDSTSEDENYAKTRNFYRKMGFKPLECINTLWDENNPCLIMIMSIAGANHK